MEDITVESIKEEAWKKKTTLFGIGVTTIVLFVRFLTETLFVQSNSKSYYITFFSAFVFLCLYLYVKKSKKYENAVFYTLIFSFTFIFSRASLTGGFSSPAMAWYPVVPIISSFILTRKHTYIICALSVFSIILTSQFSLVDHLHMTAEILTTASKILIYSSVILISTTFCLTHEKKRSDMRKKLEEQRINILSSSRNSELGELASGIAHEINNPLTVVKVKARKLKSLKQDDAEVRDSIEKIISMTERIGKIVKSMKNLSKSQIDEKTIARENFTYIFESVLTLCETKMKYSNIQFKLINNIEEIDQYQIPVQLGHVILNIVNNAYDAVLEVDKKWIEIKVRRIDSLLEFRISDSGQGIQSTEVDKIFNPFYTDKSHRTGLGLSISKNNISNLGGELTLDTNAEATTFVITIPALTMKNLSNMPKVG